MHRNTPRSSSTGNLGVPPKRRRLNTFNSSAPNPSDNESRGMSKCERIYCTRELTAVSIRLSHTEAIATQLQEIRKEVDEVFDEEEEVLYIQARAEKETIENLKVRLGTEMESTQNANEPQEIAEPDMSPVKTRMWKKMEALFLGNVTLNQPVLNSNSNKSPTSSKSQQTEPEIQEVSEEMMKIELDRMLRVYSASQDCVLEPTRARGVSSRAWQFRSLGLDQVRQEEEQTRANELEELLHSSNDMTSTLRETVKKKLLLEEEISSMQKKLDDNRVEQQVMQTKCEGFISKIFLKKSTRIGLSSAASKDKVLNSQPPETILIPKIELLSEGEENERSQEIHREKRNSLQSVLLESDSESIANESPPDTDNESPRQTSDDNEAISRAQRENEKATEPEQQRQDLQINVGEYYVKPSDPRFLYVNWDEHCRKNYQGNICYYNCNKCPNTSTKIRATMQDHIWVKHYGGRFECPFCPDSPYSMSSRYMLLPHIRKKHPDRHEIRT